MGQPILCDLHSGAHTADVIVSQLATGETFAACGSGWIDFCRLTVDQADRAELDQTAEQVESLMAGVTPPMGSDQAPDEQPETAGIHPDEAEADFPSSRDSSDEDAAAAEQPMRPAGEQPEPEADEQTAPSPSVDPGPSHAVTEGEA